MGTIGGKIGLAVGIVAALAFVPYAMDMFVEPCFWEQGCGRGEAPMVIGAAFAALLMGGGAGLAVRAIINRWVVS